MSLKKIACKYFDTDNKGHITIGSVFVGTVVPIFVVAVILYSLYQGYKLIVSVIFFSPITMTDGGVNFNEIVGICAVIVVGIMVTTSIVVVIWAIAESIWNIKLVKCEYKNDDEETNNE